MKKQITLIIFAGLALAFIILFCLQAKPKTIRGKKYFISHSRFYYRDTIFID